MEYGHLAPIELLFFYDRTIPERRLVTAAISQKSLETDIKHGYHADSPAYGSTMMGKYGPLWSNFNVWAGKIIDTFDRNGVSNPDP
jgi:hypothetical protein